MTQYAQICDRIAKAIALGDFGAKGKLPSERKLAELFQVSRVTIRSALEEAQRRGIITRRHGSGTYANPAGAAQLDPNSLCFAFELIGKPLMENPYVSMSIDGLSRAAVELGFRFDLLPIPHGGDLRAHFQAHPELIPAAKAVIVKWGMNQLESVRWLQERGHVVVAMGPAKSEPDLLWVDIDNELGGRLAAEHLLALGRRRLAYADGPLTDVSVNETLGGIRRACQAAGCPFAPELLREVVPWEEASGAAAMRSLLDAGAAFDGVIFRGDMASLGAVGVLKERGVEIPARLSFVTYDDYPWLERICTPALSAVRQPFDLMAETAAAISLQAIRNPLRRPESRLLAPTLQIRESCGATRSLTLTRR